MIAYDTKYKSFFVLFKRLQNCNLFVCFQKPNASILVKLSEKKMEKDVTSYFQLSPYNKNCNLMS